MDKAIIDKLIELAKDKCKISWNDKDTEKKVRTMVENAAVVLKHKLGMKRDADAFTEPGQARMLFENYCLYDWNNMTAEFEKNYKSEILTERHKNEVENGREKNKQLQ